MLELLPCLDSDEMAATRERELSQDRRILKFWGHEVLNVLKLGYYVASNMNVVEIGDAIKHTKDNKRSISPDAALPRAEHPGFASTRIQVTNETTLGAAGD